MFKLTSIIFTVITALSGVRALGEIQVDLPTTDRILAYQVLQPSTIPQNPQMSSKVYPSLAMHFKKGYIPSFRYDFFLSKEEENGEFSSFSYVTCTFSLKDGIAEADTNVTMKFVNPGYNANMLTAEYVSPKETAQYKTDCKAIPLP